MLTSALAAVLCAAQKPNIVFIFADDLGYGELGSYGQRLIKTPNLDRLAKNGMRFTDFYSGSPVCAPSRSTFIEGKSTRTCVVRENRENGDFTPQGTEGQYPLPAGTVTIGGALQKAGYVTACIGKWGLGGPESTGQTNLQGFDYFYGYNCQRQAHNYYPDHLWRNNLKVQLKNPSFPAHQKLPEGADPNDPASYDRYKGPDYSPDLMTEEALGFIDRSKDRPFMLYVAYTIPHVAIQVPDDSLKQYDGVFDEAPYLGNQGYLPHIRPKSAYAAMVTIQDTYVGQIVARLKAQGLDKNTLVVFSSDNGPSWVGGMKPEFFDSTAGLRGRKAQIWEGGIRVPMIASWPGKIKLATVSSLPCALWDFFPTFAAAAGAKTPPDTEGVNLLPTLTGKGSQAKHPFMYWEFASQDHAQAVRIGDWKAIRFNGRNNKDRGKVFLYNLRTDRAETTDVAANHPDIVQRAQQVFASRVPSDVPAWEPSKD